ncbi:unnamed protein product [Macrosiphum euphorbiae]|uniref:Uncharacterized protein n=1 Tax=Macrosiphum euphorbiae TaxID=13131 RepID=A0AAV0W9M2_9HEMI|nr:unnamed protein product [Macrosiphum euphorbiae]
MRSSTSRSALVASTSNSSTVLDETTNKVSSAKPSHFAPWGSGTLRTESNVAFQRRGPTTDPCGTPPEISTSILPLPVETVPDLPQKYDWNMRYR